MGNYEIVRGWEGCGMGRLRARDQDNFLVLTKE